MARRGQEVYRSGRHLLPTCVDCQWVEQFDTLKRIVGAIAMHRHSLITLAAALSVSATFLSGCAGGKECEPEPFDGSLFLSSDDADAKVSGTLRWPASVEEGLIVELGLQSETGGYVAAVSRDGLFDFTETCGTSLDFTISDVDAGVFRVWAGIQEEVSGGDSGAASYVAEGRSDELDTRVGNVSGVLVELQ